MPENREDLYTQKLFPTVNNADLLEFRMPPNAKGHLDLSNVRLHFVTELNTPTDDHKIIYQNHFGAKQFSSLEVRINGEAVSRRSCANEYFLAAYFQSQINFTTDYQMSALKPSGIFDVTQLETSVLDTASEDETDKLLSRYRRQVERSNEIEIIMTLDSTIFYSDDLLPSNTPLDLSFERANASFSGILFKTAATCPDTTLELKDCYLSLPFKKDEQLFRLERNALQRPLKIKYDDYQIKRFNIPKGTSSVMMSDLLAGPLPGKLFWALQQIDAYTGSYKISSTRFDSAGLTRANLYIDGKEKDGFPLNVTDIHFAQPYVKFLQTCNMDVNGFLSQVITMDAFANGNLILSTSIAEDSGSVSFEFDFKEPLKKDLVLITCALSAKTLKLDHNRNFKIY